MKLRTITVTAGLLIGIASACGTPDDNRVPPPPEPAAETTTTATPTTSTETTTTTAPEPELDLGDAATVWTDVLTNAASGDEISNASGEVVERLGVLFDRQTRELTSTPSVEVTGDSTVQIDDCVVLSTPLSAAPSVWFRGTATHDNNTWTVDDVTVQQLNGCVPASVAAEVVAAYEAHWDAQVEFWNPPDPDHPLIAETTTGAYRELMEDLARRFQADGQVLKGRAETNPEVWQYGPTDFVVLIDCFPTNPELGVYDAGTGERTDLIPPIAPGQIDLLQSTLLFEDGVWRVSDVQENRGTTCEPAPSSKGLPVVGAAE